MRLGLSFCLLIGFVTGLAAVYSSPIAAQENTLTVWHQKENASELIHNILQPVAEKHKRELKVVYLATNELKSGLITSIVNNSAPDVALIPSDFFGESKNYRPAAIPNNVQKQYALANQYWQLTQVDGEVLGVPLFVGNHMVMYYNKSLVDQPATSLDGMLEQQKSLPEDVSLIGWNYGELYWFIHFMTVFNAYPIVNGEVKLDTPEMAAALKYYRSLSLNEVVSDECDYTCAFGQFGDGKFAYVLNGDWAYRGLKDLLGGNLGISLLPAVGDTAMQSYFSAVALMYPGRGKDAELSKIDLDVLNALNSYDAQMKMFAQFGLIPANARHRKQLFAQAGADYQPIIESLDNANPLPSNAAMSAVWVGLRKGFDYYHGTNVDAQRAVQIMQTVANRELVRLEAN